METRPKITIEISATDRLIEISGWITLAILWILILYQYKILPATIPVHFNTTGEADNYGDKSTIFLLPIIGSVLFIGITILNLYPQVFNYPVKITADNAARQYTLTTRLLRILKIAIALIFLMITWMTTYAAKHEAKNTFVWFLPVMLVIIFVPLGIYIVRSFKSK